MKELTPEQWARVDALFDEALDRPDDERTAFLRARCGDDPHLYDQVVALLQIEPAAAAAIGDNAGTVLHHMLAAIDDARDAEDEELASVGPYRIERSIGRGGMGTVYLAERADGTFEKSVALKLVKRGMDTDEVLRRFRYERQILAGLDHPNIARILDAGAANDGRPYFVLEYCDGDTITDYCDSKGLPIDQRLLLFEQVCEAVAYAHRHLVVHRDLKPGNIMVSDADGGTPTVKLLDFGIAQLTENRPDAPITRADRKILTPEYAAPEQARGETVTTAADVYALGVVLHELLVGSRPTSPLKRPSTVVTAESVATRATTADRLRRHLKTDLDAIVVKALQEEPEDRYISADALLEDLRRRRDGLPLAARPPTLAYRTRKYVARHKWGVGVAALALLAAALFVAALDQQRRQTIEERDLAQANASFLKDLFEGADPFSVQTRRPDTLRATDLLARGVARARATLDDRPLLQASTLQTVGSVYGGLSMFAEADTLLSESVETFRRLLPTDDPRLSESLHELGVLRSFQGRHEESEALLREALQLREKTDGAGSAAYAQTLVELASTQFKHGKLDDAEDSASRALSVQRRVDGSPSLDVATTMTIMGRIIVGQGRPADAEPIYREALDIRRALLPDGNLAVAESLDNLGIALQEQRRLDEAETIVREALDVRIAALGEMHTSVADTRYNLAIVLRNQGKFEESIALQRLVQAANEHNLGPDHPYVGYNLISLGVTKARMGEDAEALELYGQAYEQLTRTLPESHSAVLDALGGRGYQYIQLGQPARGEPFLRRVMDLRLENDGPGSWRTGVAESTLGQALMEMGRDAEAEELLIRGFERIRDAKGPQHAALRRLVSFYSKANQPERAAEYQAILDVL